MRLKPESFRCRRNASVEVCLVVNVFSSDLDGGGEQVQLALNHSVSPWVSEFVSSGSGDQIAAGQADSC